MHTNANIKSSSMSKHVRATPTTAAFLSSSLFLFIYFDLVPVSTSAASIDVTEFFLHSFPFTPERSKIINEMDYERLGRNSTI